MIVRLLVTIAVTLVAVAVLLRMPALPGRDESGGGFEFSAANLQRHVRVLSEEMLPRTCEFPQELMHSARYIETHLAADNERVYLQTYRHDGNAFANVVSRYGPATGSAIVVGAHYDAYASLPGADDNASGVAGLLELGRALGTQPPRHPVVLVAYACEEPPYFATTGMGSFVHANSVDSDGVRLMISLEMIGYFNERPGSQQFPLPGLSALYPSTGDYVAIVGSTFSLEAARLKSTLNRHTGIDAYSINAPAWVPGVDFSDHRNYWSAGIAAVMVTDTAFYRNFNYHTPGDTFDTLDYAKMKEIVSGVYIHITEMSDG